MIKKHWRIKHMLEGAAKCLMVAALLLVAAVLALILITVILRGLPALSWQMLTQTPQGGYYMGKEGGILNAILGSLYMAGGATLLALLISLPLVLFINRLLSNTVLAAVIRLTLDILWGIPSIVYGAFGFSLMLALGMRASLLGGIIVLTLLALPIMTRAMDEVVRRMPVELEKAALALGDTPLQVAFKVVLRQSLPGVVTAVLLAFGRTIGDAASVLFTAGYTDRIPTSLMRPAASLPLAIFFQLNTPFPEVQQRAYAAALVLTLIVLFISLGSRLAAGWLGRYTVK